MTKPGASPTSHAVRPAAGTPHWGALVAETPRPRASSAWWTLASVGLMVGGLIHFILVQDHFTESAAAGLFFLILASLQVSFAFALGRHRETFLLHAAVASALVSVLIYAFTRVVAAPFAAEAEGVDGYGFVDKLAELVAVAALFRLLWAQPPVAWERWFSTPGRRILLSILLAIVLSALLLGLGYASETWFPGLGEAGGHTHAHG